MALTRELAEFVAGLRFDAIPEAAVGIVKRGSIDCVGVLFAGIDEPVVRIVRESLRTRGAAGEARLLFGPERADAAEAALLNATAAHALDYDDVALDGHPSVVLVPAMLAEGECAQASGPEMIAAYAAGYEVWAELLSREPDKLHGKGWHPTTIFGTVAVAATAARLAKLDAGRTANALGIAASMAAGVIANFGSMTKPFQVGRAAQNGVHAARLAAAGLTASPDALEHPNGYLRAVSPQGRARLDGAAGAGTEWRILREGLNVKRYPVCYALHRCVDGMLGLVAEHKPAIDSIAAIELSIGRLQAKMLRHHQPQTALDAKFSAEFAMASCAAAGRLGLGQLSDDFVRSPQIQALMAKVRTQVIEECDPESPLFAPADSVLIELSNGRVLRGPPVARAKGHAQNPLALDELRAKFTDCAGSHRTGLFDRLLELELLENAAALYAA
jgi:2-methylcitrate dehydratase PrpD